MYFAIPVEQFTIYIVSLSFPLVIEILLDRNEINLMNYEREHEARFAKKLLSITSD